MFSGDEAALMRDGIITTKVHTFTAMCSYADSATISVGDLGVTMTTIDGDSDASGSYSFDLVAYSDSGLTNTVDLTDTVEIGSRIYNVIRPSSGVVIPSNVNYYVTDCVAYEDLTAFLGGDTSFGSYSFLDAVACSTLVDVQMTVDTGTSGSDIEFDFNSFTFSAASDTVSIQCDIKLCLDDGTDTSCQALGATC